MKKTSERCHVCGMTTDLAVPPLEYHKMYFHFCSLQCRETFILHPNLYSVAATKQQKEILKHRTMRLATSLDERNREQLTSNLQEMMGIKNVVIKQNRISLSYDLLQVTRQQIENRLIEIGIGLGDEWMERLRRAWVHDSEENELNNLAAPIYAYHRPSLK